MRSYELSISADYVPSWGVVEAVREFFQNAIDEETRDEDNKMFFSYDANTETLKIGNKQGKLDPKTLLFGYTDKNDKKEMIGNHGEGYKIATVVLLRLNKQITIYNYGHRQVWRPRFVKSRKYGVNVPAFFVDTAYSWQKVPDNDLVIEISGITSEEFDKIVESNLHLQNQDYEKISTTYGDLLTEERFQNKIFVGGLYICEDPRIEMGVNFNPDVVKLERDRSMVNSFDVQWYLSRMIAETKDKDLIISAMNGYSGRYIDYYSLSYSVGDDIAKDFLDEYGYDAVPVCNQKDTHFAVSTNTVVVSEAMKSVILNSRYYKSHFNQETHFDEASISFRLRIFGDSIKDRLTETEIKVLSDLISEIKDLEDADKQM